MIADTTNTNLPPIFDMVEPIIEEAPSNLQNDLAELIVTLYRASANETIFMLKHVLTNTQNPMTAMTLRRISTSFPPPLQFALRDLLRAQPLSRPKEVEIEDDFVIDELIELQTSGFATEEEKPRKIRAPRKPKGLEVAKLIYLHGLDSTSQSGKARQFAEKFPGMLTPDFTGSFEERMGQLESILGHKKNWTIIGSSYGGLMGTVFASEHPTQVRKLILLAPAILRMPDGVYHDPAIGEPLKLSAKSKRGLQTISVPTIIIHGTADDVVPLEPVRMTAEKLFTNLQYIVVDDGHRLHKAFEELNWQEILA